MSTSSAQRAPGSGAVMDILLRASKGSTHSVTSTPASQSPTVSVATTASRTGATPAPMGAFEKWRRSSYTTARRSSMPHPYEVAAPADDRSSLPGSQSQSQSPRRSSLASGVSALHAAPHSAELTTPRRSSVAGSELPPPSSASSRRRASAAASAADLAGMPATIQREWIKRVTPENTTARRGSASPAPSCERSPDSFTPAQAGPAPLSMDDTLTHADGEAGGADAAEDGGGFTDECVCSECLLFPTECRRLPCGHVVCARCAVETSSADAPSPSLLPPGAAYTCRTCEAAHHLLCLARLQPARRRQSTATAACAPASDDTPAGRCGRCQKEEARVSCLDCKIEFCSACSDVVHAGALAAHYLQVAAGPTPPATGTCPKSGHQRQRLSLFDATDSRFACEMCVDEGTTSGDVASVSDAAEGALAELRAADETCAAHVENLRSSIGVLRDHRTRVASLARGEAEHIATVFDAWRRMLDEREEEIRARTTSFYEEQKEDLEHELGKQMTVLATLNRNLQRIRQATETHDEQTRAYSQGGRGGDAEGLEDAERRLVVSRTLLNLDELQHLAESASLRVPALSQLKLALSEKDWAVVVTASVEELKAEEAFRNDGITPPRPPPQWSTIQKQTAVEELSFSETERPASAVSAIT